MNTDSLSLIKADDQRNVLHSAAINGNTKVVDALLKKQKELGVDLDVGDKHGFSPFFLSAYFGHGPAIQAFLDNSDNKVALLTKDDKNGFRAVDYAAGQGKSDALKVFHKADGQIFNKRNKRGKTALYEAVISNKTSKDAVVFILANTDQNMKNDCDTAQPCKIYAAIHAAAHNDTVSADILELLLNDLTPEQLDAEDKNGWTPLRYAILSMNEDKVEKMLKSKKVDINKKSLDATPLQYAIQMQIKAKSSDSVTVLKNQLGRPDGWDGKAEQISSPTEPKADSSWQEKYVYDVYNRLKTEARRLEMVKLLLKYKPNLQGSFATAAENHDLEILAILDKEDPSLKNEMGGIGDGMPANNAVVMAIDFAISEAVSTSKSKNTYQTGQYTLQNQALDLVKKRTIATLDKLKELGVLAKAFSANILIDEDGKEILWPEPIMYSLKVGNMVTQSWHWHEIESHLKKLSSIK